MGARIRYHAYGTLRRYDLYDQTEAQPKRAPTEAQRNALAAAQRACRTCRDCGVVVERPSQLDRRRRCPACIAADVRLYHEHGGVLVEIGIIGPNGRVVFASLVNPRTAIAPEAEAAHGLTVEQLADAPTFAELEPPLRALLTGRTVVA